MADRNAVLRGPVKYREGKKWKSRWCVMKKLSPVADRLHISLYKDRNDSDRHGHEKANIPLEHFFGIESGLCIEKEQHVMAIVCQYQVVVLALPNRDALINWEITVRAHLGEERQYPVRLLKSPPSKLLQPGPVKLVLQQQRLCLLSARGASVPPTVLSAWNVTDLRRYGVVDGKFCFEAGTRSCQGSGVYAFSTEQGGEITEALQRAAQGKLNKNRRPAAQRRSQISQRSMFTSHSVLSPMYPHSSCLDIQEKQIAGDPNFLSSSQHRFVTGSSSVDTTTTVVSDESNSSEKLRLVDRDTVFQQYNIPTTAQFMQMRNEQQENNINEDSQQLSPCPKKHFRFNSAIHRRYSCSDLNFNFQPDKWIVHTRSNGSLDLIWGNCKAVNSSIPSPLVDDWLKSCTEDSQSIQKMCENIDACRKTLSNSDIKNDNTELSGQSGDKSLHCLFESHGHCKEMASTKMTLLDDILRACNLNESPGVSTSGSSCSSSAQDLTENTPGLNCSVGSISSEKFVLNSPCFNSPFSSPTHSNKTTDTTVQSSLGDDFGTTISSVSTPRATATRNAINVTTPHMPACSKEASVFNMSKPLEYVDLDKYDGVDDGYLYWVKAGSEISDDQCEPARSMDSTSVTYSGQKGEQTNTTVKNISSSVQPEKPSQPHTLMPSLSTTQIQTSHICAKSLVTQMPMSTSTARPFSASGASQNKTRFANHGSVENFRQREGDRSLGEGSSEGAYVRLQNDTYDVVTMCGQRRRSMDDLLDEKPPSSRPADSRTIPSHLNASPPINIRPLTSSQECNSNSEYMLMQPGRRIEEDGPIFCAVQLPPKRPSSASTTSRRIRTSSLKPETSTDAAVNVLPDPDTEESNYMRMSFTHNPRANQQNSNLFVRSSSMREATLQSHPRLNHSKSWDRELSTDYLHMSVDNTHENESNPGPKFSDYLTMQPNSSEGKTIKPFDNLLEHQHHLHRTPSLPPRPIPTNSAPRSNNDDEESKVSRGGLFSRFIRRNSSSKDRKISKSQEDILSDPIEPVPEIPTRESFRPCNLDRRYVSSSDPRTPERQRAMSVPGRTWLQQQQSVQTNLSFDEKQSNNSLLLAVPPPPERVDFVPDCEAPCKPPLLPPKTYTNSRSSGPLQRASSGGSVHSGQSIFQTDYSSGSGATTPSHITSSDSLHSQSDSTVTMLHVSDDESPPPLPAKNTQRKTQIVTKIPPRPPARNRKNYSPTPPPLPTLPPPDDDEFDMPSTSSVDTFKLPTNYVNSSLCSRLRRGAPNLTVNIVQSEQECQNGCEHSHNSGQQENATGCPAAVICPTASQQSDGGTRGLARAGSDRSETLSVSSYSSSGTTSVCSEDQTKTSSPAATTLRPRFGREYQKVDRRRLAEELNVPLATTTTTTEQQTSTTSSQPTSVASNSIFNFDVGSLSSYRSNPPSAYSSGTDSPHSPSLLQRRWRDPDYVNICIPASALDSPRFTNTPPPSSPHSISGMSVYSNSTLHYAEIDLSGSEGTSGTSQVIHGKDGATDYAMIDMIATAAASRVGKEHAQLREDSLRRTDSRSSADSDFRELHRRGRDKKGLCGSGSAKDKRVSRGSSNKDRKFSAPM